LVADTARGGVPGHRGLHGPEYRRGGLIGAAGAALARADTLHFFVVARERGTAGCRRALPLQCDVAAQHERRHGAPLRQDGRQRLRWRGHIRAYAWLGVERHLGIGTVTHAQRDGLLAHLLRDQADILARIAGIQVGLMHL